MGTEDDDLLARHARDVNGERCQIGASSDVTRRHPQTKTPFPRGEQSAPPATPEPWSGETADATAIDGADSSTSLCYIG